VAFVVIGERQWLEENRFGADVAANRGLNIRVFDSEQPAMDWLME